MNKSKVSRKNIASYPFIFWSVLFIIIPLLIVLFFGFTVSTPDGYAFSVENFKRLVQPQYIKVFERSCYE